MTDETPSWTKERVDQLRSLWTDVTLSASMIGKIMGITKNTVIGKVHRLGLPKRDVPSNLSPEQLAENKAKRDTALALEKLNIIPIGVIGDKIKLPEGGCRWIDGDLKDRPDNVSIEEMHCMVETYKGAMTDAYCKSHYHMAYKKLPKKEDTTHAKQDA